MTRHVIFVGLILAAFGCGSGEAPPSSPPPPPPPPPLELVAPNKVDLRVNPLQRGEDGTLVLTGIIHNYGDEPLDVDADVGVMVGGRIVRSQKTTHNGVKAGEKLPFTCTFDDVAESGERTAVGRIDSSRKAR